jgi:hypothetical protein
LIPETTITCLDVSKLVCVCQERNGRKKKRVKIVVATRVDYNLNKSRAIYDRATRAKALRWGVDCRERELGWKGGKVRLTLSALFT